MNVLTPGYEFKDLQTGTAISISFVKDEDINIKKDPASDAKKKRGSNRFKTIKKEKGEA